MFIKVIITIIKKYKSKKKNLFLKPKIRNSSKVFRDFVLSHTIFFALSILISEKNLKTNLICGMITGNGLLV